MIDLTGRHIFIAGGSRGIGAAVARMAAQAGATCFLLSDLAGFITGATLTVDGGMDMRG